MSMRMLIDARHSEEIRVAVVKGNRIEEFDFESAEHKQLKGNIYLAKVTRVEPSLQAAFVDYGGNRHGFLAFSEIHPDYYQIPVADRQALLEEEARHERDAERDEERAAHRRGRRRGQASRSRGTSDRVSSEPQDEAEASSVEPVDAEPMQAPMLDQDDPGRFAGSEAVTEVTSNEADESWSAQDEDAASSSSDYPGQSDQD